ncbi:MAG: glycosyltransferase family 2 protein, partial [Paludibacteraceae bacterium]|nr:glycosyltransferase family 2 protein [Paludibacteraceae bacterium]
MKRIAAITMARNDNFFLGRWIAYYGQNIGYENLYVLLDGKDQTPPECPESVNVEILERKAEEMTKGDRTRIALINRKTEQLLENYDLVIGCDADEILVVDPVAGKGLKEYLSAVKCKTSISGLGMDVGQKMDEESALDKSLPFLSQRKYALLDSQYTKPVVKAAAKDWGAGFHRVKGCNYHIDSNLYLFHFGSVDYDMLMAKTADAE